MEDKALRAWEDSVPAAIKCDPLWKLIVYRLALRVGELAHEQIEACGACNAAPELQQLRRAVVSISANIAEAFGRSGRADRARFLEYALGSAREGRDWYYKSRQRIGLEYAQECMVLLSRISGMLVGLLRRERERDQKISDR